MLKNMAWNTFKNTGSIDAFIEYRLLQNIEKSLKAESNGNNKDKRDNYIGK